MEINNEKKEKKMNDIELEDESFVLPNILPEEKDLLFGPDMEILEILDLDEND